MKIKELLVLPDGSLVRIEHDCNLRKLPGLFKEKGYFFEDQVLSKVLSFPITHLVIPTVIDNDIISIETEKRDKPSIDKCLVCFVTNDKSEKEMLIKLLTQFEEATAAFIEACNIIKSMFEVDISFVTFVKKSKIEARRSLNNLRMIILDEPAEVKELK